MMKCAREASLPSVDAIRRALLDAAQKIADEDIEINKRMGAYGAELVPDDATIIHHCNTGSLAAVGWGTALGVVRSAFFQGKRLRVLVDEVSEDVAIARSAGDAPQIDGVVRIATVSGENRLRAGDWADVEIVSADSYDLAGRLTAARGEAAGSGRRLSPRSFPGTA